HQTLEFFFSSRRRHTRCLSDWSSDVCSSDLEGRGPYAGAVGYLSFGGDLDTCITIRTLVVRGDEISVTAGAGIVADSDPAAEQRSEERRVGKEGRSGGARRR